MLWGSRLDYIIFNPNIILVLITPFLESVPSHFLKKKSKKLNTDLQEMRLQCS